MFNQFDQISIGRENQANIGFDRALRSGEMDLAVLKDAQKPSLRLDRQLADPVEKKRAALRLGVFASGFAPLGLGNRSPFAAKQRRFEVVRRGAAIEGHERASAPARSSVDCARESFLAGAGLAFEKHGDGQFRCSLALSDGASHFRAVAREVLERQGPKGPSGQKAHFFRETGSGECVLDRDLQPLRTNRLHHEIMSPQTHCRDGRFDRCRRNLHDNWTFFASLLQLRKHRHAV